METKLYVGNISWDATEEKVKELFSNYGQVVSVQLITDKMTGRLRGFGFVEMTTQEEVEKAISGLNETDFLGRKLKVNLAQAPKKRTNDHRGGGGGDRGGSGRFNNRY